MKPEIQTIPVITLPMLLAANSTKKANELVVKYGMPKPKNQQELIMRLSQMLRTGSEDVAKDFVEIHPHTDFIMEVKTPQIIGNVAAEKEKTSKPICPGKGMNINPEVMTDQQIKTELEKAQKEVAEKSSNLEGDKYKVMAKEWMPVVVVGGLFLVGLAIVMRFK